MTNNDENRQFGVIQPQGVAPRISNPEEVPMPKGILGRPMTNAPHVHNHGVAKPITPALRSQLPKLTPELARGVRDVVRRK